MRDRASGSHKSDTCRMRSMSWLRWIISTYRTLTLGCLRRRCLGSKYSHTRISCILYLLESCEELARDSIINFWLHVAEILTSEETHNPISKSVRHVPPDLCPTLSVFFTPSKDGFNKSFIEQNTRQSSNRGRETSRTCRKRPRHALSVVISKY